jgi:hypothetical protein
LSNYQYLDSQKSTKKGETMTNFQQGNDLKTKKVRCWPARIVGIIGLFFALWLWSYGLGAIPENPKAIPLVILIGLMIVGGLIDCVRIGREGIGGLIVLLSGIIFYIFLLFDIIVLKQSYSEGQKAALAGILILFLSGFLFYLCGRRRRKLKE